jgi:hypothetical protein
MKKILFLALLLFYALPGSAQFFGKEGVVNNPNFDMQRFSWGYFLGFNTYDFDVDYKNYKASPATGKDFSVDRTIGFNVGLVGNMRLSEHLDLRLEPGVSFNRINFQFTKADSKTFREINSTFVHIPLLLKFSTTRINNYKPFVVGGVSTSINLSSNENNPDDNDDGQFRMTTNNYYYEIGFGIDLYLYYFKFTPSIRGIFAINDEFVRDDNPNNFYSGNVDKMSSRGVFVNFTFQ